MPFRASPIGYRQMKDIFTAQVCPPLSQDAFSSAWIRVSFF